MHFFDPRHAKNPDKIRVFRGGIFFDLPFWCGRRDSNPHTGWQRNLNPSSLPIPPRPLVWMRIPICFRIPHILFYHIMERTVCQLKTYLSSRKKTYLSSRKSFLAAHGIRCDDAAFDIQHLQQFWNRGDLVRLLVCRKLSQHHLHLVCPRTHHMDRFLVAPAAPAYCFAVDADNFTLSFLANRLYPCAEAPLEFFRLQHPPHALHGIMRWNNVPSQRKLNVPYQKDRTGVNQQDRKLLRRIRRGKREQCHTPLRRRNVPFQGSVR